MYCAHFVAVSGEDICECDQYDFFRYYLGDCFAKKCGFCDAAEGFVEIEIDCTQGRGCA